MSEVQPETPAPEAAPAPEAPATEAPAEATAEAPAETLLEKVEHAVGGILGDHPRKSQAEPHEVQAIQAGEAVITSEQLDEIEKRSAVSDIRTLVAACRTLLAERGQ